MKGLFFLIVLMATQCVNAQTILDRSQKKRPEWYGRTMTDYMVVSATDKDLETAKQKALTSLKVQILQSVAQNVEYSTETIVEQLTHGQQVESNISFRQEGSTRAVSLPYISGVALSKATESYWELQEDKATHERQYVFSMLYPYPQSDYQKLKSQFEELDQKMEETVRTAEKDIQKIEEVKDIEDGINKLKEAQDYFFDKRRKDWAQQAINSYKRIYSQLVVESKRIGPREYRCWLTLEGRKIGCATMPKLKSECASNLHCASRDGEVVITFDDSDCIADEPNTILVVFTLNQRVIKYKLNINNPT